MLPDPADYDTYGGEKQDYFAPEDETTDRSAEQVNEALADVAAMTRMACRAYVVFVVNSGVCTVVDHDAVWGKADEVKPAVDYNDVGSYIITWPSSVNDARGAAHSPNLRVGLGQIEAVACGVLVGSVSAASAWVTVWDNTGNLADIDGIRITVFVW